MAKPKGSPKTGGRQKGTPNRDKQALLERMREVIGDPGFDPVVSMAVLAHAELQLLSKNDPDANKDFALRALNETAQYVKPKLKAIQHDGQQQVVIFQGMDVG